MKKLLTVLVLLMSVSAWAQDATVQELKNTATKTLEEDTTHKHGWKKGLLLTLGLAQGGTNNWAAGGERSSFSVNSHLNLYANWKEGKNKWTNNLDLFYAVIRTTSQGMRKNDDRIDYFTKYVYMVQPKVGLGVVGTFRTQFTKGFDYQETPQRKTSDFLPRHTLPLPRASTGSRSKTSASFYPPYQQGGLLLAREILHWGRIMG